MPLASCQIKTGFVRAGSGTFPDCYTPPAPARAAIVRIKDIVDYEGVRDNQLVGYGLVVGLNGSGDRLTNTIFTRETLIGMLNRLGVNIRDRQIQLQTHDVAAVMVTATLPLLAWGWAY